MGRPRNLFIKKGSGHYSTAERKRREFEASMLHSSSADLFDVTPECFVNSTARKEYDRILNRAENELPCVSNLYLSSLIAYSNSYGIYYDIIRELKKNGLHDAAGRADQLVKVMRIELKGMAESLNAIGVSKRYQKQKEEDAVSNMFGSI